MEENSQKVKKLLDESPHWTIGWGNTLILAIIGLLVIVSFFIHIRSSITFNLEYNSRSYDTDKNGIVENILNGLLRAHDEQLKFTNKSHFEKKELGGLRNEIGKKVSDWIGRSHDIFSKLRSTDPFYFENDNKRNLSKSAVKLKELSDGSNAKMIISVPKSLEPIPEIGGKVKIGSFVENKNNFFCSGTIIGITKQQDQNDFNILIDIDSTNQIKDFLNAQEYQTLKIQFKYEHRLFDSLIGLITNKSKNLSMYEEE
ncbi:hypothetical protein GTQ34_01175 [Muricauda sp. JGD-17]|uniref:HlyD family secretion protein n=1 Tax=Flagellimonas ochracea TaxID=2696472 RepID=A0A964TAC0_9FLAO|nr:hypothetical protein [Allomuricauda ochracea]NAY90516.1 hypothetical protein [Allomuricauda ochracea]